MSLYVGPAETGEIVRIKAPELLPGPTAAYYAELLATTGNVLFSMLVFWIVGVFMFYAAGQFVIGLIIAAATFAIPLMLYVMFLRNLRALDAAERSHGYTTRGIRTQVDLWYLDPETGQPCGKPGRVR